MSKENQFPRTSELPRQSTLFWVAQKDRYLRQLMIKDIEEITKRRLLVYFGNRLSDAEIDVKDAAYMLELLSDVDGQPFDLLLETTGGETDATESLISAIRNCSPSFRVIVANAAKSNGTLVCLAATSIIMGAASELGPIEPQLRGVPCSTLALPEAGSATELFGLHIEAKHALKQTEKLARTLLRDGMMKGEEGLVDDAVSKLLMRGTYYSHGSVIDHSEASNLGLKVEYLPPNNDLWKRFWMLHCTYDYDCQEKGYIKVFESSSRSAPIAAPTQKG